MAFNQLLLLLRQNTINLYKELSDDPAYPINYHYATGGMRLLTHQNRIDEVHHIMSVAKGLGDEWMVTTDKGMIIAEHIVVAAGYRVNEVGALMGIEYPVIAMVRQSRTNSHTQSEKRSG